MARARAMVSPETRWADLNPNVQKLLADQLGGEQAARAEWDGGMAAADAPLETSNSLPTPPSEQDIAMMPRFTAGAQRQINEFEGGLDVQDFLESAGEPAGKGGKYTQRQVTAYQRQRKERPAQKAAADDAPRQATDAENRLNQLEDKAAQMEADGFPEDAQQIRDEIRMIREGMSEEDAIDTSNANRREQEAQYEPPDPPEDTGDDPGTAMIPLPGSNPPEPPTAQGGELIPYAGGPLSRITDTAQRIDPEPVDSPRGGAGGGGGSGFKDFLDLLMALLRAGSDMPQEGTNSGFRGAAAAAEQQASPLGGLRDDGPPPRPTGPDDFVANMQTEYSTADTASPATPGVDEYGNPILTPELLADPYYDRGNVVLENAAFPDVDSQTIDSEAAKALFEQAEKEARGLPPTENDPRFVDSQTFGPGAVEAFDYGDPTVAQTFDAVGMEPPPVDTSFKADPTLRERRERRVFERDMESVLPKKARTTGRRLYRQTTKDPTGTLLKILGKGVGGKEGLKRAANYGGAGLIGMSLWDAGTIGYNAAFGDKDSSVFDNTFAKAGVEALGNFFYPDNTVDDTSYEEALNAIKGTYSPRGNR